MKSQHHSIPGEQIVKKKLILKNKKEKPLIKKEGGRRLFLGKGGCRENCGDMDIEAFTESVLWKN